MFICKHASAEKYYIGIGPAKENMVVIGGYCDKMVKLGTNQKDGAVIASHQKGRVELLGEKANQSTKKVTIFPGSSKGETELFKN
jgi:hypothetical protein